MRISLERGAEHSLVENRHRDLGERTLWLRENRRPERPCDVQRRELSWVPDAAKAALG